MYALMKVALGRRGSVGPGLPLAALVALVAAMAALLLAYNASPARAAGDCSTTAGTTTCTYSPTGAEDTFVVPDGVSTIHVVATGAPGAVGVRGATAGRGATVSGDLTVAPGQPLYVEVGGAPTGSNTSNCERPVDCIGGFNGGGGSIVNADLGGGGGGASDVRTVARDESGSLDSRLIVAGGGGGSGGGNSPTPGCQLNRGGSGGDAGADGGAGETCATLSGGTGGKAGTQSAGGAGGSPNGQNGSEGLGGNGGIDGGGGGGGLFGGGGGGSLTRLIFGGGSVIAPAGGGGGGSNLVPTGGTETIATTTGPSVTISYTTTTPDTTPPTISVSHTGANAFGWNKTSPVTLNVSASDTGSGLVASGPTCKDGDNALTLTAGSTAGNWTASVSSEGTHTISCSVSDNDGNSASDDDTVMIDKTAPSVSGCSVTPSRLKPPNHKLVDGQGHRPDGYRRRRLGTRRTDAVLGREQPG